MRFFADDPGDLDRLHDIVTSAPTPWWPPAPAWYVVLFTAAILAAWFGIVAVRGLWRNRYRREGLALLDRLTSSPGQPCTMPALADLVKRVALAAYPREEVAGLTGTEWLQFLDSTGHTSGFTAGPGVELEAGYRLGTHTTSPQMIELIRQWIKHHRVTT